MDDAAVQADFEAFVHRHWSTLMTIATTVSGTRSDAEDLVQTALTNSYRRWRQVRPDEALAYLRRSILNANVSRWRRHRGLELIDEPPETTARDESTLAIDNRRTLVPLLRTLPDRQRAVLVLRYLCDLPDDEISRTLHIAPATVRSQAHRGLATLRAAWTDQQEVTP